MAEHVVGDQEREARQVPCPGCGAEVGKPCRSLVVEGGSSYRPPETPAHLVRVEAARSGSPVRKGVLAHDEEER